MVKGAWPGWRGGVRDSAQKRARPQPWKECRPRSERGRLPGGSSFLGSWGVHSTAAGTETQQRGGQERKKGQQL